MTPEHFSAAVYMRLLEGYCDELGEAFEWAHGVVFNGRTSVPEYADVLELLGNDLASDSPSMVSHRRVFESIGYKVSDDYFDGVSLEGYVSVDVLFETVRKLALAGSYTASNDEIWKVVVGLERVILEYVELVHLTPNMKVGYKADAVFGKRIGVVGSPVFFWKEAERKATESLGILLAGKVSTVPRKTNLKGLRWGKYGDKRSFVGRVVKDAKGNDFGGLMGDASRGDYGSDVDLERVAKVARYDAFGVMGEAWARGIVVIEGAMRSYLKNIGFSFDSGEGSFWRELGIFGDYSVPKGEFPLWRWLLLREAYLASYVWAWGQFLYGGWSGFTGPALSRYRRVMASYSSGLGAMTRKVNVPYWEGKPMAMKAGCSFTAYIGVVFDWRVLGSFYDFAEPGVLVDDRLAGFNYGGMKYEALGGKDIVPVFGVGEYERKLGGKRVMQGKFDEVEVGGKKEWRVGYTDTGYPMVGVDTPDLGSAAQTVGLLFLAGNNRYQMLKHGTALAV